MNARIRFLALNENDLWSSNTQFKLSRLKVFIGCIQTNNMLTALPTDSHIRLQEYAT